MYITEKIIAYIVTSVIIAIALVIFLLKISSVSIDLKPVSVKSDKVTNEVTIYRNLYGIPHIIATSDPDLFFGIGYAQAEDRLWQMDLFRRTAFGRLSEILGEETVVYDKFMKSLELSVVSEVILDSLILYYPEEYKSLESYSAGINHYISMKKNRLPLEFSALNYVPEEWKPIHTIAISRLMGFEMSISFWIDMAMAEIAAKIGIEKTQELIPEYFNDAPYVMQPNYKSNTGISSTHLSNYDFQQEIEKVASYIKIVNSIRESLNIYPAGSGSNSWVIKKDTSDNSAVVIANDPHLGFGIPARWYQMQVSSDDFHSVGMTIPGLPIIIVGRNTHISWGITNTMADVCDLFIHKIDESGKNYFINDTNKRELIFKTDTIKVLGQEDVVYYRRYAAGSIIISDFHLFRTDEIIEFGESTNEQFYEDVALSFKWVGSNFSNEFVAGYWLNKASNWDEFSNALNLWGIPALNFTYSDVNGNIGIKSAGLIPNREPNCNPNMPNPYWAENTRWKGVYTTENLPYNYNPAGRYLFSANNKHLQNETIFISNYYEPDSRARRIEELLAQSGEYSARDAQIMQNDVLSPYARELISETVLILENFSELLSPLEFQAYELMKNWDYILSADNPQPTIYYLLLERIIYNTFYDELGDRLYKQYLFIPSLSQRKIHNFLRQENSDWFDNINTEEKENKEYIIFTSFQETIGKLNTIFDNKQISAWRYGDLHRLNLEHLFSDNPYMKATVSINNLSMGGDNTTINCAQSKLYEPFKITLGASGRFIADMSENIVYMSLPGGVSGDPIHPNYSDQVQIWLNGGYIRLNFTKTPAQDFQLRTTIKP